MRSAGFRSAVARNVGKGHCCRRSFKRSITGGRGKTSVSALFYKENNRMLFGDAKKMLDEAVGALKG